MPDTIDSLRRLRWDCDDGFFATSPGVVPSLVDVGDDDFDDPDIAEDMDELDEEEEEEWEFEESEEEPDDEGLDDDEL